MPKKGLLDNDNIKVEVLRLENEGLSVRKISERLGISKTSIHDFLSKKNYREWWDQNEKPIASGSLYDHHQNIKQLNKKRYIVTSAQNNTFVHEQFLQSLETAAEYLDAQIIVGTFSYNLNGFQNLEKSEGEWFDPKIVDYVLDEPVQLADGLLWCGELNILPTAVNPLSGLQSYTRSDSGIVPHAKVQLESLPTHKTEPCRMMYTTGAVTLRNYIEKKTGQKASFHHVFGALLVEVDDDGDWFVRQLIADSDTGIFQDLDVVYTPTDVLKNAQVEAINWGDIHVEKLDWTAANACFDKYQEDSMLDTLRPKYQFIHDAIDFTSRNHHNRNDPYFLFKQYYHGNESVEADVMEVRNVLKEMYRNWCELVIVESNHDLALKRWLKEADYKSDPVNAVFFLECQLEMYRAIQRGDFEFSVLEHKVKEGVDYFDENVRFLKTDESFKICDSIECGMHGHIGVSGSKGTASGFTKLGSRVNIGHSHSAKIVDGVYQAGHMMDLDKVDYAKGPSTWSVSHIVTYPNGKRTIITMTKGKWHA